MSLKINKYLNTIKKNIHQDSVIDKLKNSNITKHLGETKVQKTPLISSAISFATASTVIGLNLSNINSDLNLQQTNDNQESENLTSTEKIYINNCEKLKNDLQITHPNINPDLYIEMCSYFDKNGNPQISEILTKSLEKLIELFPNQGYYNITDFKYLLKYFILYDKNGNPEVNEKVLSIIEKLHEKKASVEDICNILKVSKNKNENFSYEALDFAVNSYDKIGYETDEFIINCFDKDGFNTNVANFYNYCIANNLENYAIKRLAHIVIKENDDQKQVQTYDLINKIQQELKKENSKLYYFHPSDDIYLADCEIEDYLQYYDIVKSEYNDKGEIASVISFCLTSQFNNFGDIEKKFDKNLIEIYEKYKKKLLIADNQTYNSTLQKKCLGNLLKTCKLFNGYYEQFDENMMQKAIEIMNKMNISIEDLSSSTTFKALITEIMEFCKIKKISWLNSKREIISFDEEMYNKLLDLSPDSIKNISSALELSKEFNQYTQKESIDFKAFDMYYNFIKTQDIWFDYYKDVLKDPEFNINKHQIIRTLKNKNITCSLNLFIEKNEENNYKFSYKILDSYEKISKINYQFANDRKKEDCDYSLIKLCKVKSGSKLLFDSKIYEQIIKLLEKKYSYEEIYQICYNNDYIKISQILSLIENGIDINSAVSIINSCYEEKSNLNPNKLEKSLELYKLGLRDDSIEKTLKYCYFEIQPKRFILEAKTSCDEIAYGRLKELIKLKLPTYLINTCRINEKYDDRVYRLMINLIEKNYPIEIIHTLIETCIIKSSTNSNKSIFSKEIYDKIFELERLGIKKLSIPKILKTCKLHNIFDNNCYNRIKELYYKGYDDSGIFTILNNSFSLLNFYETRYNQLLQLTINHKKLKDINYPTDAEVINSLLLLENKIKKIKEIFGQDILNYISIAKMTNFISYIENFYKVISKISTPNKEDIIKRLSELPSPELKVQRLEMLGSLVNKIDETGLIPLIKMIQSPRMTDEQKNLANVIFSKTKIDYETKIERFLNAIQAPDDNIHYLKDILLKERLDKHICRPQSIELQTQQMKKFATQILTNPNIPQEKKNKYMEEFNAKKDDMIKHPDKYTTPFIYPKVMNNLAKIIQAYVNIPNDNTKFKYALYELMYDKYYIKTTPTLLKQIKFDSKYFSKLLNTSIDFNRNFVRLIEFMKLNPRKNLNEIRNILPEKNTKTFEEYEDLGLIEQIEANLDTKRQFQDNKLDYEWWNNYDENFKGNKFDVEIDTKLEYENLRFNLINEINGNLIDKINSKEKEKLFKKLENGNYSILNFEILKNNQVAQHSEIGTLIEKILNHIKTEQYWKSAIENDNIEIPQEEKDAITAFYDHIKGYKKKFNDIKNGRCINNLSFRLADSSNIGRNLFFGNHVGCCNSVESAYAGFSAPQHLLNSYIRGLEIIDEYGNSYGNTLCYFALSDNKISFVIDSFEANGKLASNSIVVENLIKFAKQICEKIGAKDAQIIAGPNFGNLDFSSYPSYISKEFKIIGTVSEYTYCDTVGGKTKDNINQKLIDQIKYYKLS